MWDEHEKHNSKSAPEQHLLVLKLSTSQLMQYQWHPEIIVLLAKQSSLLLKVFRKLI